MRSGRLVLWDIDGTLLDSSGEEGVRLLRRALAQTHPGLPATIDLGDSHGKTDLQIAREVFSRLGVAEAEMEQLLLSFVKRYTAIALACRSETAARFPVLAGVAQVLGALTACGVGQSVLTGNLEPVAQVKLASLGLLNHLDLSLGAFGSDDEDRTRLVAVARERAHRRWGAAPDQIVVVGDTPRDVECARAGGARAVAVATGIYAVRQLAKARPDAVLPNLSHTPTAVSSILGLGEAAP